MNIIIVGAGVLGIGLTEYLSRFNHEITLVEHDDAVADAVESRLDVMTVVGSGSNPAVLEQAGIRNADMIIAATPSDDVNLLACHFAMQYRVEKRIARVISGGILSVPDIDLHTLGVTHAVETEKEIVMAAQSLVELPGLTETADFLGGNVFLRGYRVDADMPICGKNLLEIRKLAEGAEMLVVAIIRDGASIIPSGSEMLIVGDEFLTIMPRESYGTYRTLINRPVRKIKKVIVSGDTAMAVNISEAMSATADRVLLLDANREHAEEAAARLDKVEVLLGDATDTNFLQEVNIAGCDFYIAAGKDMEDNIMSCFLAKAEGARRVVALRDDNRHFDRFLALGIDHVISPRLVTMQRIIESIQIASIDSLLKLQNAGLSIVRAIVSKRNNAAGKPLSKLYNIFKKGIIVGAVIRDRMIIIPKGGTEIAAGDELIIICYEHNIPFINRIFKADFNES
ncbi:MAG: Trk system potassium transporter TrkA [Chitinispirillales bacterium]|nr:Trk system potassium transporter TrkA [Chitinispirillales bacterium]